MSKSIETRTASVNRDTLETQISVSLDLDGTGKASFDTGIPFLEHMLDQIARHGLIDIPDSRKQHTSKKVSLGGIAMFISYMILLILNLSH